MRNVKRGMRSGFTLVEMMIVVAIIAILAGIAMPQYTKFIDKSRATEASGLMKQIVDGEVEFLGRGNKDYTTKMSALDLSMPDDAEFDYNITVKEHDCFAVSAYGKSGGHLNNKTLTLVYPSKVKASETGCKPKIYDKTAVSDPDDELWVGNIYYGEFYGK